MPLWRKRRKKFEEDLRCVIVWQVCRACHSVCRAEGTRAPSLAEPGRAGCKRHPEAPAQCAAACRCSGLRKSCRAMQHVSAGACGQLLQLLEPATFRSRLADSDLCCDAGRRYMRRSWRRTSKGKGEGAAASALQLHSNRRRPP